jgi:hypothetical protein
VGGSARATVSRTRGAARVARPARAAHSDRGSSAEADADADTDADAGAEAGAEAGSDDAAARVACNESIATVAETPRSEGA